jgi:stage III sporulation protein AB
MESHKLSLRVEKLEAFLRFLSSARAEIRYSSMPAEALLRNHSEGICFFSHVTGGNSGTSFADSWNSAVAEYAACEGFGKKDMELLREFGAGLGATDTEGQVAHFRLYENLTSSALDEAKEERRRKAKLYKMLGLFGGTAAAILLC